MSDLSEIMITLYFQEARMPGSNYSVAYVGQAITNEIIAKYKPQAYNLKAVIDIKHYLYSWKKDLKRFKLLAV